MKITFVGLSCFLLEDSQGSKLLIDPYKDSPEWYLGLKFPPQMEADLFLVSHPDEDHNYLRSEWLRKRKRMDIKDTSEGVDIFPELDLKGTLVKEYNGDLNIAYSFTLDGIRFLHLADNAHILTHSQLNEIGTVDVIFMSPPKFDGSYHIENTKLLKPKLVIPSHYIPVPTGKDTNEEIVVYLRNKIIQEWVINPAANDGLVDMFSNMLNHIAEFKDNFSTYVEIPNDTIEITKEGLNGKTQIIVFRNCLGG